ncbi:DUF742 domain-containing protein [Micromonospora sp. WMMA1923]|uniref:DUF742 domain-containing protein n=1 Tax=Micromonospora sp. WMMA1923 TaxID=3404125 RepID=UPI003B940A8D
MTHPKARPYTLTGGRTRTRQPLLLHTLVSATTHAPPLPLRPLAPEAHALHAHTGDAAVSVAELSAAAGLPLGVTRVLVDDLVTAGLLTVHADTYQSPYDPGLLERVRDGIRRIA